jgi:DNA helicase HerA-like ATPase
MDLYLGKEFDPKAATVGAPLRLDASDLLTHGLIVGMTGSGKTGLAIGLIEEVLRQGVPVLAIDPKGDLGNLLLLFDRLDAASFAPWIDPDIARRNPAAAQEAAAAWSKGLADWGLSGADIAALRAARDAAIYTPGSTAGIPLDILQSLDAPPVPFESAEEDLRDEIVGIVSGLLGLLKIEADPLKSPEHVFLSNLIESSWRAGRGLTLETLIAGIGEPPFEKLGALPVDTVFPRKERQALMMAVNSLLASPSFADWRRGEPLDIERLLRTPDGRPRLSVIYTAHLSDEERLFVTALVLDKVKTWMRRQGGTTSLRALVYMDEIYGYFPPHPANPPTKKPLLTLLKQARAQGVGVVLATQNPVDLDYKGLANIGTWMVGKLQTDQDRDRLRDGLADAGAQAAEAMLDAARKRVFLLHDVHRPAPCLLHSRWTLSYLRGPLTREDIERLTEERTAAASAPAGAAAALAPKSAPAPAGPPVLPPPFRNHYLKRYGGELAEAQLLVKFAVRYKGASEETIASRLYPFGPSLAEILDGEFTEVDADALAMDPPAGVRFGDAPAALANARAIEKMLKDRLADKLAVNVLFDAQTKSQSNPGEDAEAFAARLREAGSGAKVDRLREQIDKKKRDLALKEEEAKGRTQEKLAAVGQDVLTAGLSVLGGLFGGGKKSGGLGKAAAGVARVGKTYVSKDRMENTAEARVEILKAEIAEAEQQLADLTGVDPGRFEQRTLVPTKTSVKLLRYDVVWVH